MGAPRGGRGPCAELPPPRCAAPDDEAAAPVARRSRRTVERGGRPARAAQASAGRPAGWCASPTGPRGGSPRRRPRPSRPRAPRRRARRATRSRRSRAAATPRPRRGGRGRRAPSPRRMLAAGVAQVTPVSSSGDGQQVRGGAVADRSHQRGEIAAVVVEVDEPVPRRPRQRERARTRAGWPRRRPRRRRPRSTRRRPPLTAPPPRAARAGADLLGRPDEQPHLAGEVEGRRDAQRLRDVTRRTPRPGRGRSAAPATPHAEDLGVGDDKRGPAREPLPRRCDDVHAGARPDARRRAPAADSGTATARSPTARGAGPGRARPRAPPG